MSIGDYQELGLPLTAEYLVHRVVACDCSIVKGPHQHSDARSLHDLHLTLSSQSHNAIHLAAKERISNTCDHVGAQGLPANLFAQIRRTQLTHSEVLDVNLSHRAKGHKSLAGKMN